MTRYDFDAGIFAANEAAKIQTCIESVDAACAGRKAHLSIILNGTIDETIGVLKKIKLRHAAMTVYLTSVADKANAVNHFIHDLRQDADVYFGIDGYVTVAAAALDSLGKALRVHPQSNAASGVPATGRSAKASAQEIMRGGMLAGQLYALRREFLDTIKERRLRLPLQLYRGDGLLGSMAAHNLDAMGIAWDDARVLGVANATFAITPLSPFRYQDIRRQFHREIRQARGRMENAAIKSIIYSSGYAALPSNANTMLRNWLTTNRPKPRSTREAFFTKLALRQLARSTDIEPAAPTVVFCSEAP